MNSRRLISALTALLLGVLACNVPASEQDSPPSAVQTSAALTVEALLSTSVANTVTATAQQSIIVDTPAPTGTITPTYSVPMLTVLQQTNCRAGPGQDYEIVFTYLPNKKLEILGRYDPTNYWLVKSNESPIGTCWLWGEFIEVTGSYWTVSSVTPPPTSTLQPPATPSIQKWDFFCSLGNMTITIVWTDRATNEIGYRIIRDGRVVAELPADSTTYSETIELRSGESAEYYIQVYNVTDTVNSSPIRLTC
jgi:hypothetical protein